MPLLSPLTLPLIFALTSLTFTLTLHPDLLYSIQRQLGPKIGGAPTVPSLKPFRLSTIFRSPRSGRPSFLLIKYKNPPFNFITQCRPRHLQVSPSENRPRNQDELQAFVDTLTKQGRVNESILSRIHDAPTAELETTVLKPCAESLSEQATTVKSLAEATSKYPFYKWNNTWNRDVLMWLATYRCTRGSRVETSSHWKKSDKG